MARLFPFSVVTTFALIAAPFLSAQEASANRAILTGRVYDADTGLGLNGTSVSVADQAPGVVTDLSGRYRIETTEGTTSVTFSRDGYASVTIRDVVLSSAEPKIQDAQLGRARAGSSTTGSDDDIVLLEAVVVTSTVTQNSAAGLTALRQRADVAVDAVSPEMLTKFSAGDAAEALIRVPGVSVAGGEFAVIRGLSDRYGNTLLNGLKVPSPDPEKQAVQLDLFPSNLLDTIVVSKTFMPDLWGDTSGGSVDLATKFIPDAQEIQVSFGLSANENTLGKNLPAYGGASSGDLIGFGAGDRPGVPGPGAGSRPASPVIPVTERGLPGEKVSVTYGDRFQIRDHVLGVTFAVAQETDVDAREGQRDSRSWRVTPGPVATRRFLSVSNENGVSDYAQSEYTGSLSSLLALGYEFSPDHRISVTTLFAQSGISTAERQTDVGSPSTSDLVDADGDGTTDYRWFNDTVSYRERNLGTLQLQGEHLFTRLSDLRMDWALQHAMTYQDEPAFSEAGYGQVVNDPGIAGATISGPAAIGDYFLSNNNGAIRPLAQAWSKTEEAQNAGRLDFTLPFTALTERESQLKFGGALERTDRDFSGRADTYAPGTLFSGSVVQPLYDSILTQNGPTNSTRSLSVGERQLDAAYLMTSFALPFDLKLAGGVRVEAFDLTSSGDGQFGNLTTRDFYNNFSTILGTTPDKLNTSIRETDYLPAIGLTWNPTQKLFFRTSYSQTVARPSFREVGAYFSQSLETGNLVLGNPALGPSAVENLDFRVERFFGDGGKDLVAASVFGKKIDKPIEKVVFNTTEGLVETWNNNPGQADLTGFELELRKNLGFLGEPLRDVTLSGNYTRIAAEVPVDPITVASIQQIYDRLPADRRLEAETTRRLFDQPESIANLDLTWEVPTWQTEFVLSYFYITEVLSVTGSASPSSFFYDSYERGYSRLDFGISKKFKDGWSVRLQGKNLTDPERGLIYDPESPGAGASRISYRAGRDFSVSVSKKF